MAIGSVVSLSQSVYPASMQYGSAVAVPSGAAQVTASATMASSDVLAGPPGQRTIALGLQSSYDGGQTWQAAVSSQYTTGPTNLAKDGTTAQPPVIVAPIKDNPAPSHVRPYVSLNGATSIGVDVSFADATGNTL